ncbi:MAG TPA: hypothetical protein VGL60_09855 [Acidimicrobiales bacterium]|jgi:hypothetical protein
MASTSGAPRNGIGAWPTAEEVGAAVIAALRTGRDQPPTDGTGDGIRSTPPLAESGPGVGQTENPTASAGWAQRMPVSVMLRPIASGLPFGLFGLVVAATITGSQAFGLLPTTASLAIGVLLFPTAVAQLVGGVCAVLGRDVIGASLMIVFSGVWLGTALVYVANPPDGLHVLAIWYLALSPVAMGLISSATGKLGLAMVPITGLPMLVVTAVWLLSGSPKGLGEAAGVLSFALALAGLYAAIALLLEDARGRTILPTLRSGPMRESFTADFTTQLKGLEHEAGVRRYL